jgi:BlaI family penicillinase repressor
MQEARQLGALQLSILRVLWERGEASVAEVHQALHREHRLALTTIATMLKKMEAKELVDHRVDGRVFVYRATYDRAAVERSMVAEFVDRAFLGDPLALVNHLLAEGELDAGEIRRLKETIAKKKREKGGES